MSTASSTTSSSLQHPLPFPEWSDTAINSEYWEAPKGKERPKEVPFFVDEQKVLLPPSLAANMNHWRRPADIFKTEKIVIYEESVDYSNLAQGSKHLFHSEFVRHFISSIGIMEYTSSHKPFTTEGVTLRFTPNSEHEQWRPWNHVYSLTKAGRGQKHRPLVNQTGKYIVRLFWMGCWRQITVDDKLPVDADNNILLPSYSLPLPKESEMEVSLPPSTLSSLPKDKASRKSAQNAVLKEETREIVQIWPYILSKALLKIASLTWNDHKEIVDFDIISCFTGWIVQRIDTRNLTEEDKWEICSQFSNHYAWNDDPSRSQSGVSGAKSKQSIKSKKSTKSVTTEGVSPFYLVGICSDLSCSEETEVPEVAPCCSHLFLIEQTRNIPLVRPEEQPELERWKKFRWLAWAIQKGLIKPPDDMDPIKCLKLISTLRWKAEKQLSKSATCIKMSAEVIDEVTAEFSISKNEAKGANAGSPPPKDQKSIRSTASNKSKKSKTPQMIPLPDISLWCDFNTISKHIDCLHVYFKPSAFQHKTTVTNMTEMEACIDPRVKTKAPSVILHSSSLKQFRNEPLYIFVDSLDYKFLLFNLVQPGSTSKLKKAARKLSEEPNYVEITDIGSSYTTSVLDLIKSRRQCSVTMSGEQNIETASYYEETPPDEEAVFSMGHLIVEDYNWKSERTSTIRVFLNSLGAKSILTNLREGRFCLTLWIETNEQYILNVLSDTEVTVGSLEVILESMEAESHRLMNCCFLLSSAFGQLVQSLGTQDYAAGLRRFYRCLTPTKSYNKQDLESIWKQFFEKLLNYLQETLQESDYKRTVTSLRVLFLNPSLGCIAPDDDLQSQTETITAGLDTTSFTPEDILILKEIERSAVTIQAFFKRIYVRILKRRQNPSDKCYMMTYDYLKKVYTTCFSVEKRLTVCISFLRDLLQRPAIAKFFPWIKNAKSVVRIESYNGASSVTFANWIPICRYLFYCRNEHPVTVKICLFGEIEQCLIRVFDNDSGKEIPRYTYNCNTFKYFPNKKGYSVLCYGWTKATKTNYSWRLHFIMPKQSENEVAITDAQLETHTLTMGYIPNVNQQIFSCSLTLQQDTLATFRLCTSTESSKLLLQCAKNNKVLTKICGNGNVILPAIFFECDSAVMETDDRRPTLALKNKRSSTKNILPFEGRKPIKEAKSDRGSFSSRNDEGKVMFKGAKLVKKETMYSVEGFVLEDSWPLTVEEWEVVKNLKKMKLVGPSITAAQPKIKEKSSSRLTTDANTYKPFWCLQTVFNKGDVVSVVKDTTREDKIKDIKRTWYAEQPERSTLSEKRRIDHVQDLKLYMHSSSKMSIESFSDIKRTCKSPELMLNLQHNKNLLNRYSTAILSEDTLLDRKVQTPEHDAQETAKREEKIQQFLDYHENFLTDMNLFLQEQLERCSVLKMFISNCRIESGDMSDAIQEKRRQYVELVCPPLPTNQKGRRKK